MQHERVTPHQTSVGLVTNPLAKGKVSIGSNGDTLQGQKVKLAQDQPPAFLHSPKKRQNHVKWRRYKDGVITLERDAA